MTKPHDHGTYYATNRRNIDRLQDERDQAGLHQLIDVLEQATGWRAHHATRLIDDARTALTFIERTTPELVYADSPHIRIGDIIRYTIDGHEHQAIVLSTDHHAAHTNLGHTVPLDP